MHAQVEASLRLSLESSSSILISPPQRIHPPNLIVAYLHFIVQSQELKIVLLAQVQCLDRRGVLDLVRGQPCMCVMRMVG